MSKSTSRQKVDCLNKWVTTVEKPKKKNKSSEDDYYYEKPQNV